MKTLIAALCLFSTLALAQNLPQPAPQPAMRRAIQPSGETIALPENLVLKLIVKEKEQIAELSIVVATSQFSAQTADTDITFSGTITPEEDGTILVRYALSSLFKLTTPMPGGGNNTEFKNSQVQASVRLRMGEPVQVLKAGTRTYELTVSRLEASPKKGK